MFAFLALAGDLGATAGPAIVGNVAELVGEDLKNGLLAATIFPICMTLGLFFLYRYSRRKNELRSIGTFATRPSPAEDALLR